jgi:hypothetical protein
MTNNNTVYPVLTNSVEECELWSCRAHCAKYRGMRTKKAIKCPVRLVKV